MKKDFFEECFAQLSMEIKPDFLNRINNVLHTQTCQKMIKPIYNIAEVQYALSDPSLPKGSRAFFLCRKLLIIGFILKNWREFSNHLMLKKEYDAFFNRIYWSSEAINSGEAVSDDIFWKDLAIARLQAFPVYAGVVEFHSGFGLKQGLSANLLKSITFLFFILKHHRKMYFRTHIHTPLLSHFSREGWVNSYLQIASVLKVDKSIKGLVRTSWYFDPKVKIISPHLSYLQELPLENGAYLFPVGVDDSGCALKKSHSRIELYDKGEYTPMNYLLIWPRDVLISWSEKYKESEQ